MRVSELCAIARIVHLDGAEKSEGLATGEVGTKEFGTFGRVGQPISAEFRIPEGIRYVIFERCEKTTTAG
jgi:hypothetical protein